MNASNPQHRAQPPLPFSLRTVFFCVTFVAMVLGGYVQLARLQGKAQRDAVRQAVLNGSLPLEKGREILGDEVDQLATRLREP